LLRFVAGGRHRWFHECLGYPPRKQFGQYPQHRDDEQRQKIREARRCDLM
jgi:hypothetical protein